MPTFHTPEEAHIHYLLACVARLNHTLQDTRSTIWKYKNLLAANPELAEMLAYETSEVQDSVDRLQAEADRAMQLGDVHG